MSEEGKKGDTEINYIVLLIFFPECFHSRKMENYLSEEQSLLGEKYVY